MDQSRVESRQTLLSDNFFLSYAILMVKLYQTLSIVKPVYKDHSWDPKIVADFYRLFRGYYVIKTPIGTSNWCSFWADGRYLEVVISSGLTVLLILTSEYFQSCYPAYSLTKNYETFSLDKYWKLDYFKIWIMSYFMKNVLSIILQRILDVL